MTPFGLSLLGLRQARGMRQKELAARLQIDPSYLCGLETGRIGPPSSTLVKRVQVALGLDELEALKLKQAADLSRRKFEIPLGVGPEGYVLVASLIKRLTQLSPAQIRVINEVLNI